MDIIENKIHFIWVGDVIPEKYAKEILRHLFYNNNFYKIFLWTDMPTENSVLFKSLRTLNNGFDSEEEIDGRITLTFLNSDYSTGRKYSRLTFISTTTLNNEYGDLYEKYKYAKDKEINYGRASDILRLIILEKEGGIYMDTDVKSLKSLPPRIVAEDGFLMGYGQADRESFTNAVMAAPSNSNFVKKLIKSIKKTFKYYDNKKCNGKTWWEVVLDNIRATKSARTVGKPDTYSAYQMAMESGTLAVTGPTKIEIELYQHMIGSAAQDPYEWIAKYIPNLDPKKFTAGMGIFKVTVAKPKMKEEGADEKYKFPMEYIVIGSDASWM